jgi:hypothetical protein
MGVYGHFLYFLGVHELGEMSGKLNPRGGYDILYELASVLLDW